MARIRYTTCQGLAFASSLMILFIVLFNSFHRDNRSQLDHQENAFRKSYFFLRNVEEEEEEEGKPKPQESNDSKKGKNAPFKDSVQKYANSKREIFLATFDTSYVEMAVNLYFTSFLALKINNYLFIETDSTACMTLANYGDIHCCSHDFNEKEGKVASAFGSSSFKRKTHYKTKVILDALNLGFSVVIVDLDIVFFKNPMLHFPCNFCDIQIQNDTHEGNTGFYLVRPTPAAIELHRRAYKLGENRTDLSNQKAVDRIMEAMNREKRIKMHTLTSEKFPCGKEYFEKHKLMFLGDGTCAECVMVHNNWIVSKEAKIYRFKENGMWQVDTDKYYSDPSRKYITYDNPVDFGKSRTAKQEKDALKVGLYLGYLLNRTLILPSFHCYGCNFRPCKNAKQRCALNANFKIATFDKYFKDKYREHVFLSSSKVPDSVKKDQSETLLIKARTSTIFLKIKDLKGLQTFNPKTPGIGATPSEIISWFGGKYAKYSVLRFHSFYGATTVSTNAEFNNKLSNALKTANYMQI